MANGIYANTTNPALSSIWFSTNVVYKYNQLPNSCTITTDFTEDSYFLSRSSTEFAALEHLKPGIPLSDRPYTTRLLELQKQYIPEYFI